jgi:hypothetical protein
MQFSKQEVESSDRPAIRSDAGQRSHEVLGAVWKVWLRCVLGRVDTAALTYNQVARARAPQSIPRSLA